MKKLKFYKTEDGLWFVDLPEWEGEHERLQMVAGADTFLDLLSEGGKEVTLAVSTEPFSGASLLKKAQPNFIEMGRFLNENLEYAISEGQIYELEEINSKMKMIGASNPPKFIWLCDVTCFVFDGAFPDKIYFTV